jgi:transposase
MSELTNPLLGRGKKSSPREPADHALGRTRGGWDSKVHLVTDSSGLPLAVELTAGQAQECKHFDEVLNAIRIPHNAGRPRQRPGALAGDKGYSYNHVRRWLRRHRIRAVIPQRRDQLRTHKGRPLSFDRQRYRRRNVIERAVGWLKERRRIATRFEKLALRFLAMLEIAMIESYLGPFSDTP